MKLSVLLGLREKTEKSFASMLSDMITKFTNKQGIFKGIRKEYTALEGFADEPSKKGYTRVASTVKEQLQWFLEHTKDHLQTVMAIEATNAMGPKAHLIVDGDDWGEYTTLELLRLKTILDGNIRHMIQELPIRNESISWTKSDDPEYKDRAVFQSRKDEGFSKTTLKETYILTDPHIEKGNRQPVVAERSTTVEIGRYAVQEFSGEISNLERAKVLVRFDKMYKAITAALEEANTSQATSSDLGTKAIDFLFEDLT